MGIIPRLSLVCTVLLLAALGAAAEPAPLLVPGDVQEDYRRWLDGRDPLTVAAFDGPGARRDVVEVALVQQALALGGWDGGVALVPVDSYLRALEELRAGRALATATCVWRHDLDPATADGTAATLAPGEFTAGLYTEAGNTRALALRDRAGLAQLSATCNPAWRPDWGALAGLGLAQVEPASSWEAMVRLVGSRRIDVLLAPFQPTPGMELLAGGHRLVPIPGFTVALAGERCFALSRGHALAGRAGPALLAGVQRLVADGTFLRAYRACGFLHPAVAGWTRLEPAASRP